MKFLLAAVNAKYIHSNLGIYSLNKYAQEKLETRRAQGEAFPGIQIEMGEYTINQQMDLVLQDIYRRSPDVAGFSCYIWNILYVKELVRDLKKVMPQLTIWLGGPEVSYNGEEMLRELPEVTGVMAGEGEETFFRLVESCGMSFMESKEAGKRWNHSRLEELLKDRPGFIFRKSDGTISAGAPAPLMELSRIPFSYGSLEGLEHRIIYYESSRGCPFSCSYCLSSVDKALRFRPISLVKRELDWFLERKVPQVKFVDRTFNCKKSHALAIWRHILEHDNGVTNFHFEIAADLLDEEAMELLEKMRPGLVQLEIGVQSTNPETLREIHRRTDIGEIRRITARINSWHNIHQHLDLIAGLPWEGIESFRTSFNEVYGMEPEQLQLGFLKVLKGSHMAEMAESYGLVYSRRPPYEVLSTRWLCYEELLELKGVEEMVEIHYNSRQFVHTLGLLQEEFSTPYDMFLHMARFYREQGCAGLNHSRVARYEILWKMIGSLTVDCGRREIYRDALVFDLYLRENAKSRPEFARDQNPFKERMREFYRAEAEKPRYLPGYQGCDGRQLQRMTHLEGMGDGTFVLFDYRDRDPLDYNARTWRLDLDGAVKR